MIGGEVMSRPRIAARSRMSPVHPPVGLAVGTPLRWAAAGPVPAKASGPTPAVDPTASVASPPARPAFTGLACRVLAVDVLAMILAVTLVAAVIGGPSVVGLALVLPLWALGLQRLGGYRNRVLEENPLRGWTLYAAVGRVAVIMALVPLLFPAFPATAYIALLAALLLATVAGRALFSRWVRHQQAGGRYVVPVVLRGPAKEIEALLVGLARDSRQPFSVRAVQVTCGELTSDLAVSADQNPVDVARRRGAVSVMMVGPQREPPATLRRQVWMLESAGIQVVWVPLASSLAVPKAQAIGSTGVPMLTFEDRDLAPETSVTKLVIDFSLALIATVLLAPWLLAMAVAISLDSPGPVLFRQTRVGRHGRHFTMYKFRTMREDAEDQLEAIGHLNIHEGGTLFKIPDDPRVTRVGKWLRKFSLDELPQLLNVLRGEMSMVGPRPPLPREVQNYPGDVHRRFVVRPGLTGLWQVSGRSDLDPGASASLDTHYVEHWTPMMDTQILIKTVKVVLIGDGAY